MYLICGLGNPGSKYENTLHNAGFFALDVLIEYFGTSFSGKWNSLLSSATHGKDKLLLQKPLTFMNRSGEAVGQVATYYKVPSDRVIVLHDDIDLEFGRLKLKIGGSEGGHNGLRSITQHLGTRDYLRVRIGVGRPSNVHTSADDARNVADYVLKPLNKQRLEKLQVVAKEAANAALDIVVDGLTLSQAKWH